MSATDSRERRPETRARRRIRRAVESRGRTLRTLEWEQPYMGGEMEGVCGGWWGTTDDERYPEVMGLNVDDVIACVDSWLVPTEGCLCRSPERPPMLSAEPGWCHEPTCKWHLPYHLRWWPEPAHSSANPTPEAGVS